MTARRGSSRWQVILVGMWCAGAGIVEVGAQSTVSPVVGVHKVAIGAGGATFFAAPMQRPPVFRGTVAAVGADTIRPGGEPGWVAGQFGIRNGFKQFWVVSVKDASANPGNAGDWWLVTGNDAGTLTVDTSFLSPTATLAAGDTIEIRPLTSVADLFGAGAGTVLRPNLSGAVDSNVDDVIRRVEGTFFSEDIFYYGGSQAPAGYYTGSGEGPLDGTTITFRPDEPVMVFRHGTTLNLASVGRVQQTPLTHFLSPGATAVSTGFPVGAPIGSSGLLESGWTPNTTGVPDPAENDLLRYAQGTFFVDDFVYYAGDAAPHGWYSGAGEADAQPLESSGAYVAFVTGSGGLIWRQPPPF